MVPKLRFSEFNTPWKQVTLGEVCADAAYGMNSAATAFDGSNKYIRITDIDDESREFSPSPLTSPSGTLDNKYLLRDGDIVFARTGASVGKSYLYKKNDGKLYFAGFLIRLSINKANPCFIYNQTLTRKYRKWVKIYSMRSGQPGINAEEYKEFDFAIPSSEEQNKIADFLSSVDEKITLLNKQYDRLCQYKKGMMQKIFNQEVRFRDENGDIFPAWQENILSNLGNAYSGLTGKTAEDFGKGTFYITYKQIFDNRIIQPKDFGLVCISKNEKQNKVKYGDLFFTTSSETPDEVAFCSVFLDTEMSDCYLNSFCFGYRLKNIDKNHPVFLSFLFRSEYFRGKVKTLAQGSTRYNISKAQFMMLSVNIPVTKEQTKIANFLSALDDKIAIKKVELDRLKTWKQGLLQQMFV